MAFTVLTFRLHFTSKHKLLFVFGKKSSVAALLQPLFSLHLPKPLEVHWPQKARYYFEPFLWTTSCLSKVAIMLLLMGWLRECYQETFWKFGLIWLHQILFVTMLFVSLHTEALHLSLFMLFAILTIGYLWLCMLSTLNCLTETGHAKQRDTKYLTN